MMYYSIVALPFVFFFSRLLLTNWVVPYFKKKALYRCLKTRSDWKAIEKTEHILKQLFKNDHAKIASEVYRKMRFILDKEFIYGEIDCLSFYTLLERTQPAPQDVFYDLGSGTGKAVFTVALFFEVSKACGVELLPPLYTKANATRNKAMLLFKNNRSDFGKKMLKSVNTIQFMNDSFLHIDFSEATIIYVAATCLSDTTWESLIHKMAQLSPGTRIIVATKSIKHSRFELIYKGIDLMSWGLCPVSIYILKGCHP